MQWNTAEEILKLLGPYKWIGKAVQTYFEEGGKTLFWGNPTVRMILFVLKIG